MAQDPEDEGQPDIDQQPNYEQTNARSQPRQAPHYERPVNGDSASRPVTNEPEVSTNSQTVTQKRDCVMMGVVSSGKTTLLTAIKRACDLPAKDDLNFEFIPELETAEIIKWQIDRITGRQQGHGATTNVKTFGFEVQVTGKPPNFWTPALEAELHVTLSDGGGEFLIPSEGAANAFFRQQLIASALRAESIVLCVDITNPGSATLEKELPIAFSEMTQPITIQSQIHWRSKVDSWLRRRPLVEPPPRTRNCLNVDRFLLLLTQVDKISSQLPDSAGGTIRFADMIDPVAQARELLGVTVLRTIRSFLKPTASFAVGKISAMGFHPITGDPFADTNGTPMDLHSESGENVLRRWTPYGIRDAIYFLATRRCRGTVKELVAADLETGSELLEFSYHSNSQEEIQV